MLHSGRHISRWQQRQPRNPIIYPLLDLQFTNLEMVMAYTHVSLLLDKVTIRAGLQTFAWLTRIAMTSDAAFQSKLIYYWWLNDLSEGQKCLALIA